MIARFARQYEGKVTFMTSPGLDGQEAMAEAVKEFDWPASMIHAVDEDGGLWRHFDVLYRGAWVFVDDDGSVYERSASHLPESRIRKVLEELTAA
jgi:hypothetical protein